jgi:hypothetical protein
LNIVFLDWLLYKSGHKCNEWTGAIISSYLYVPILNIISFSLFSGCCYVTEQCLCVFRCARWLVIVIYCLLLVWMHWNVKASSEFILFLKTICYVWSFHYLAFFDGIKVCLVWHTLIWYTIRLTAETTSVGMVYFLYTDTT